ncbi:MAG TPA: DnaJ domain-containing protein [Pyrinomonadaceae bacterium]|nr:DnaJ domain-containing protein [Pyrinomonadaceae bacterium]
MKGQLSIHPLAELIREISASRLSGALRLMRERVKVLVSFDAGEVVDARSNLRPHRLAECLRRWNAVAAERLSGVLNERMTDEEAFAALAASGLADGDELAAWRARQSEDVLRTPLLWADGEWSFDPQARPPARPAPKLDARPLLLEAARRLPKEFTSARLADDEETLAPADAPPENLPLQPAEGFVLSRVDAPLRVGELVALSGLPDADARQALYTLAVCGLVKRDGWPRAVPPHSIARAAQAQSPTAEAAPAAEAKPADVPEAAAAEAAPDPRAEMLELFKLAGGETHYQVLGITQQAAPAEIKRAYYALAKRFHPDRFRRDLGEPERARVDAAFAKISQAYEVLKDPAQRASYDLKVEAARTAAARAPTRASSAGANESPQYRAEDNFRQGVESLRFGNRLQAVMHFAEAARLMPREARYRAYYGHALAGDAGTRRQAESELKAAVSLDADNASYRVMLAQVYRDLGMRLRAEGELQRALSVDPKSAEARRLLDSLQKP